jgi:hypothetical protein
VGGTYDADGVEEKRIKVIGKKAKGKDTTKKTKTKT